MGVAGRRYESLDAWRGIAALAVLIFHCGNTIVDRESLFGRALLQGWLGVFIFFPISGYCILAALNSPHNHSLGAFLTRRWRRIVPPYWASIALCAAIAVLALPFSRGSLDDYAMPASGWGAVLTLTQVFTPDRDRINPVYWSLCYEEQFYLVMGLLLLAPHRWRAAALTAVTGGAALYLSPLWGWRVNGLFMDYWPCFAPGCAAYLCIHEPRARRWGFGIFAIAGSLGLATGNAALLVSVGVAIVITLLARYDAVLARTPLVAGLMSAGTFSFSLYLTHVPVGGRVTNLLDRFGLPAYATVAIASAVSIAAAWVFFVVVEKPTLRRPTGVDREAPVAAAA